ncbi:C4-TRAP dicarboxylate transporter periplasmic binding domain-containing protein, DctP-like [Desulfonema limicola]|uniref:C4-TRAP dicarboxylate transporter periplasmic binding domain-containing protein, DctP-like n=1 Tax=Desulfonema limicola TaxID=45656 RepID=A0A975B864_9BACT|nr:TRAP transporter substrate-binding protein DctP [Desulfonema limicola]QTA80360.1 C4-TRAP dicarboxylate transporter periplasmic binding domain-containing protein, DctP-like [Desulfonema limicola]
MNKIFQSILIVCFLMICTQAYAVRIKIATLSPEGSFWMEKMREGAREVEEKTEGRVVIKYYPGGVMGDDKAVMRKIRIGQLHGGALVAGSLSDIYQNNQIYGLPLKFKSYKEIDYVRTRMDPIIIKGLEQGGFAAFGLAEGGFAYIMSSKPIQTVADLQQKKIWVPDNDPTIMEGVKAFDITPIPLSIADVRAGLQTGLIDTVTTSPIGALALQWHTQVKYLMDVPFLYIYAVLIIDQKVFSKISQEDQPVVREILGRIFKEIDNQNRQDNVKALDALRKQGIQFILPPSQALEEWYERAGQVPEKLVNSGRFSRDIVDILENHLQKCRLQ